MSNTFLGSIRDRLMAWNHRNRRKPADAPRRWGLEALERRDLRAGVVSITTNVAGDVTLQGDAADNNVQIGVFGINNALVIQGLDGTRLAMNGRLDAIQVLTPQIVGRDLRVNLGAGRDTFVNRQVAVGRDLIATLGTGADSVELLDAAIGRNLTIDGGADQANDSVQLHAVDIGGQVTANLGPAAALEFDHFDMTGSEVFGSMTLTNTLNSSLFTLSGSTVRGALNIRTGAGSDLVQLGGHLPLIVMGAISMDLGSNADYLLLDQLTAFSTTTIVMGIGDDWGAIGRPSEFFGAFDVNLGAGDDRWDFPTSTSHPSTFHAAARFAGGTGFDAIQDRTHAIYLGLALFTQFEA